MKFIFLAIMSLCSNVAMSQLLQCDPFTGSLNGSIPLMSVTSGDVSIPIGVTYHTNGVKVNSSSGTAGVGWTLSAGGSVTRHVRGLPDDHVQDGVYGWLHGSIARTIDSFSPSANPNSSDCSNEANDFAVLDSFGYANDTEPDVFNFSAPGLSGAFAFDKTKTPRPIPYQDIDIAITRSATDSLVTGIVITTNTGTKYTFDKSQHISRHRDPYTTNPLTLFTTKYIQYLDTIAFYASWDLVSIESPGGGAVTLEYDDSDDSISPTYYRQVNETVSPPVLDTLYTLIDYTGSRHLKSITGANVNANFSWSGGVIGTISFTENSYNASRVYRFGYSFVKTYDVPEDVVRKAFRLPFLTKVTQEIDCSVLPAYQFDYYGIDEAAKTTSMPFGSNRGQDIFGYYNGGTDSSGINSLYTKDGDAGTDGERYRFYPASGYSLTLASSGSRAVDSTKTRYGALQTLTLPGGGTMHVNYEPNTYYDAVASTSQFGAGIRVKSLKIGTGDPASDVIQRYTYKNVSGESSGVWIYRPMFAAANEESVVRIPENLAPDEMIYYSRVQVSTTGGGKTVYLYNSPGVYPQDSDGDFQASVSRIARRSGYCNSVGAQKFGQHYAYPFASNTNYDFERGLPSAITNYTATGRIVSSSIFSYQRSTLTVASISGIRFEKGTERFLYSKYTLLSNVNKYLYTRSDRMYDQADETNSRYAETTTTYNYSAKQLVNAIAVTDSDNTTITQKFKYAKDYASSGTDTQSQMINLLVAAKRGGTLIETASMRGSNYTGASLTLFDNVFGGSRVLPKQVMTLGDPTGFEESTVSGATFVSSPAYYPMSYLDAYDDLGNPTVMRAKSRRINSIIPGHNNSLPAISISDARNDQVVFADFEPNTAISAAYPSTRNTSDVFDGKYSLNLNTGSSITRSGVGRGQGSFYRLTCWIKSASTGTLNLQVNSGSPVGIGYGNVSAWQFIEKRIDMSSISSAFSITITATSNIVIDNVVFLPEIATYVTHSYEPLNGKTSDVDSRGNGVFTKYDAMGRAYQVTDRNRDLLQVTEYHDKSDPSPPGVQISGPQTPMMLESTTYSVDVGCMGGVTYQWRVDDTVVGTGSTLTYEFDRNKNYSVSVAVASNVGTAYSEMTVEPQPKMTAVLSGTGSPVHNCADTIERHLTIALDGCYQDITYKWFINGLDIHTATDANSLDINPYNGINTNIYCEVQARCYNETTGAWTSMKVTTNTKTYTWQAGGPC